MAILDNLLSFIQSPQGMAMAQGLLSGSQPSLSPTGGFQGALSQGLRAYGLSDLQERQRKMQQEQFEKNLELQREKLAQQLAQQERGFGLQERGLGLRERELELRREGLLQPQNLTGIAQEVASLEELRKRFGEDSEVYRQARRGFDVKLASQESMLDWRDKMIETADKRYSTSLGKSQQELNDIKAGFVPGTSRQELIESPEEQQQLFAKWNDKMAKDITDTKTRERLLFSENIDKTIENIDLNALTQFSGLPGRVKRIFEAGGSLVGQESEEYSRYQEALTAAKLLAKQMRQFYGDSVTASVAKDLENLANPTSWINSPEVAKRKFNRLVDIYQQEKETFANPLKRIGAYYAEERQSASKQASQEEPQDVRVINGKTFFKRGDRWYQK